MLPLAYAGALVPYLPQGLHPDVHTLLTDSVEPFIVGMHTSHFSALQASLKPNILVVDLDLGALATGSGVGSGVGSGSGRGGLPLGAGRAGGGTMGNRAWDQRCGGGAWGQRG